MKILFLVGFIALVLVIYFLITPTRKKPRSQYTLPPLKKINVPVGTKVDLGVPGEIVYYGERVEIVSGDEMAQAFAVQHTKADFVEAMVDSKPDETLSHSDRIEHDHGGHNDH